MADDAEEIGKGGPLDAVTLRDYVDALFGEVNRALREAAVEREKAAQALATTLTAQIDSGDARLREHIINQIDQIRSALASAEKLEQQRVAEVEARIEAVQRELTIQAAAQEKAIQKAEIATERRFDSINEWRAQAADRERSQQEQTAVLTSSFAPREVVESQFGELDKRLGALEARINQLL